MRSREEAELWRSKVPRWGTVRTVTIDGDYALVLHDLNSDFREVDLAIFRRDADRWRVLVAQDDAGFQQIGDSEPFRGRPAQRSWDYGYGVNEGGYGWAWGRERPRYVVQIQFRSDTFQVTANEDGWWLFIQPTTVADHERPAWIVYSWPGRGPVAVSCRVEHSDRHDRRDTA